MLHGSKDWKQEGHNGYHQERENTAQEIRVDGKGSCFMRQNLANIVPMENVRSEAARGNPYAYVGLHR